MKIYTTNFWIKIIIDENSVTWKLLSINE